MSAPTDFVRLQCGLENSPISRLVLFCISFYTNFKTGECWPSIPTLAKESNLHQNTVRKHLHELAKSGFIKLTERDGNSHLITLVGYKDWLDKAPARQPVTPTADVGADPYISSVEPLHVVFDTPTPEVGKIYNRNILNNPFKSVEEDSSTTSEVDETRVYFQDGNLKLCDSLNQFWLPHFQNIQGDLDLALLQISSFVNPQNKLHSLERQVSSQLSRLVRERRDRDRRYQSSKTNSSNSKSNGSASKTEDAVDRASKIFWERVERGEVKV